MKDSKAVITVHGLKYSYGKVSNQSEHLSLDKGSIVQITDLAIGKGERILLCGCNGAGKSTLLSVLGGRKLIPQRVARILGRECFDDCSLSSEVCYLGDWWRTDFFLDVTIESFLGEVVSVSDKCKSLCEILEVDMNWRISQLSDGQRRRCQILAAFTSSDQFKVYLLDEVTADLDIVSRERLLEWLKNQSLTFGITVVYATHIIDGMEDWATRVIYMEDGAIAQDVPPPPTYLYKSIREWMMGWYDRKRES
jgi:CCR4-NOT complex subunit CAF16